MKPKTEIKSDAESAQEKNLINTMNDLYQAIDRHDEEKVQKILLTNPIDINAYHPLRDDNPLIYAVTSLNYDMAKLLLELGANPNIKSKSNHSCISQLMLIAVVGNNIIGPSDPTGQKARQEMNDNFNSMLDLLLCYNLSPTELSFLKINAKFIVHMTIKDLINKFDYPIAISDQFGLRIDNPLQSLILTMYNLIDKNLPRGVNKSDYSYLYLLGVLLIRITDTIESGSFQKEYYDVLQLFKDNRSKEFDLIQRDKKELFLTYQKSQEFNIISSYISVDPAKIVLSYAVDFSKEISEKRFQSKCINKANKL